MNKLSSADLLKQASGMLQALVQERDELQVKLAQLSEKVGQYEQEERILKVAEHLDGKGPYSGMPLQERANFVREKLADGIPISELEKVVTLIAPDGSIGNVVDNFKTASAGKEGFLDAIMNY